MPWWPVFQLLLWHHYNDFYMLPLAWWMTCVLMTMLCRRSTNLIGLLIAQWIEYTLCLLVHLSLIGHWLVCLSRLLTTVVDALSRSAVCYITEGNFLMLRIHLKLGERVLSVTTLEAWYQLPTKLKTFNSIVETWPKNFSVPGCLQCLILQLYFESVLFWMGSLAVSVTFCLMFYLSVTRFKMLTAQEPSKYVWTDLILMHHHSIYRLAWRHVHYDTVVCKVYHVIRVTGCLCKAHSCLIALWCKSNIEFNTNSLSPRLKC